MKTTVDPLCCLCLGVPVLCMLCRSVAPSSCLKWIWSSVRFVSGGPLHVTPAQRLPLKLVKSRSFVERHYHQMAAVRSRRRCYVVRHRWGVKAQWGRGLGPSKEPEASVLNSSRERARRPGRRSLKPWLCSDLPGPGLAWLQGLSRYSGVDVGGVTVCTPGRGLRSRRYPVGAAA